MLDEIRSIVNSHLLSSQGERVSAGHTGEGHTISNVAEAIGVDRGNLSRFLKGEAGLSCGALDALCEYFDIHAVEGVR